MGTGRAMAPICAKRHTEYIAYGNQLQKLAKIVMTASGRVISLKKVTAREDYGAFYSGRFDGYLFTFKDDL